MKSVVPGIKAIIAKELVETHGLKQVQVAKILNISQSAVSKYVMEVRGFVIPIDESEKTSPMIDKMIGFSLPGLTAEKILEYILQNLCGRAR